MDVVENSTGLKVEEVRAYLRGMTVPEEIKSFIEGDDRKGVVDAAAARMAELGKDGQSGPMTDKPAKDFKGSVVEGTKSGPVTCETVLEQMRAKGRKI